MTKFIYRGNCKDIECALKHGFESTTIEELSEEIKDEKATRNRATVIRLLERTINKKIKLQNK